MFFFTDCSLSISLSPLCRNTLTHLLQNPANYFNHHSLTKIFDYCYNIEWCIILYMIYLTIFDFFVVVVLLSIYIALSGCLSRDDLGRTLSACLYFWGENHCITFYSVFSISTISFPLIVGHACTEKVVHRGELHRMFSLELKLNFGKFEDQISALQSLL